MKSKAFRSLAAIFVFGVMSFILAVSHAAPALAAVSPPQPSGKVSFTFDDGFQSSLTKAAPVLQQYGHTGTVYATTDCVTNGECEADDGTFLSWAEVSQLQNQYGWEVGGHSVTHPLMTEITPAELEQEVAQSKQILESHGFSPKAFATPYGDYNGEVVAAIAKYYTSHRGFHDTGFNNWPYNKYLLRVQQVQAGVSVETVKSYIDQAKANNTWLILVFHDIQDQANPDPEEYEYSTSDLDAIAAYAQSQSLEAVNVTDGLAKGTNNLLPNSEFQNGLSEGWTTDNPTNVVANTGSNGSAPEPVNSIEMVASATNNVHLFSPAVTVDPTRDYWISAYANMLGETGGDVGVYIDEYDSNGNWISGQLVYTNNDPQLKDISFIYHPSSSSVGRASAQIIVTAGSGATLYVDSLEWYSVEGDPDPDPDPEVVNILPNSSFDGGLSDGWDTDNPLAIAPDSNNNGSPENPQNSVKLTAGTSNSHLFSPKVDVEFDVAYTIKAFLNILTLQSGEVAFYVDEYNASGSWVSGQYIFAKRNADTEEISFTYTPTSSNVAQASLQVILEGNSGITGYIDNIQWLTPGSPAPDPDPDPDPTPVTLLESDFSQGFDGGWATDSPSNVTTDSTGNGGGTETASSIKLVASTGNVHLFSPIVDVVTVGPYTLSGYLNVINWESGEVAFYVDEYNANGVWISGKYSYAMRSAGTQDVSFSYVPSSASVAKTQLQIIVTGGSGITAYFDNFKWTTTTA